MTTQRIVFLPGMSGLGEFWDPVRQLLPDADTVAVDWPWESVDGYDGFVEHVTALLDRPAVLVGQSMGGYVAARVALAAPERLSHLVLSVTSAGLDMAALGATDWRPGSRVAHPDVPDWAFAAQPDLTEQIAGITVPALLLWADRDPISPLAVGRRLAGLLPRSELVVYTSDDHWVVREQATDVAHRIGDLSRFRLATLDDVDALTELERIANLVALAHVFPPDEYPYPTDGVRARWRDVLAEPGITVAVAGGVDRLDAFVAFDRSVVRHLAVHPDRWGDGVARRALAFATARMDAPHLWCLADNTRALGFYEHLGWRRTGRSQPAEWPPFPVEVELALATTG
ncbi:MAG TPA: alpha/beta fold hydrolase [Ilumatobacter sp.]|nr:alpha/beta fold hydrolase [Ilumatobacter sp.]